MKNNIVWNFDCEKYRTNGDISLTDEQLQALKNLCKYNISILNGSGGCGKSQTTTNIIKMEIDENIKAGILEALAVFKEMGAEIKNISLPYNKYSIPVYYIYSFGIKF